MRYSVYVTIIPGSPDKQRRVIPALWKSQRGPKKSLGQHFFKNNEGIRLLIETLRPKNGDFFIEIGPGKGELTLPLLDLRKESGIFFRYAGIEKDEELAEILRKKLAPTGDIIISGDAREILPALAGKAEGKLKIFGNIPYYLTGNLMRMLTEIPKKPELALFTVQYEVAERIAGEKEGMSRLRAMLSFFYTPKIIAIFGKKDFSPPPKVGSAAILLSLREESEKNLHLWDTYERVAKCAFSQPRKTLENNLRGLFGGDKVAASRLIADAGLPAGMRPHELELQNLIKMSEMVYNNPDEMQEK